MNKKHLNLFSAMLICIILALPLILSFNVKASAEGMVDPVYTNDGSLFPVVDRANLLNDDEEASLAGHIYQFEEKYHSAIVILTVETLGDRSPRDYAEDFYVYNNYGYGGTKDGLIFLIAMDSRDWYIAVAEGAMDVVTDSAREDIFDACSSDLSNGNYYSSFDKFVSACDRKFQSYEEDHTFTIGKFFICLVAGLLLALIPLFFFIGQLQTVHPEKGASNYSPTGLSLTGKHDRFVRKSVSKTKIQKESSSSSHTHSSGTNFSGGGGKF